MRSREEGRGGLAVAQLVALKSRCKRAAGAGPLGVGSVTSASRGLFSRRGNSAGSPPPATPLPPALLLFQIPALEEEEERPAQKRKQRGDAPVQASLHLHISTATPSSFSGPWSVCGGGEAGTSPAGGGYNCFAPSGSGTSWAGRRARDPTRGPTA